MGISKRNKRHSPGGYHLVHSRPVVLNKSVEVDYYKQVQTELDAKHAKKETAAHRGPKRSVPDATILQIRALREFYSWTTCQLATHFSMDKAKVYSICAYRQATLLVPTEKDVPEGVVPPPRVDGRTLDKGRPRRAPQTMEGTVRSLEEVRARALSDLALQKQLEAELHTSEED